MKEFSQNMLKLFALVIIFLRNQASSICLFPPEFEGEYIIQNAASNSDVLQYSNIKISADSISPYGQCYSRNKSNVIVSMGSEENSFSSCFRCFNLKMVSKNVILLIHNEVDINSKCSSSPETVKCPSELDEEKKLGDDFRSIILYRTAERDGPRQIRRNEFCPFDFFDGEIKFDYYLDDEKVCSGYESTLSQCPSGSSLNVRFKGCNYPQQSANFECIGHWHAFDNYYLFYVIDWINGTRPSYKCGWQFLNVDKHQIMTFRDQQSLKSYRMTLINQLSDEKFVVLSRSQCGEESFKCLWIRQLDKNILEFQASPGMNTTSSEICGDNNFHNTEWLTQSRVGKTVQKSPCPINGKYQGQLPDDLELCAVMESSCNSDVMRFQVGPCETKDIYEKRIYKCLGEWSDPKSSKVYTFTERIDDVVNTYECFVGLMAGSEKQIIIREAGENCFKGLDIQSYGMEMNQTETCQTGKSYDEELIERTEHKDSSITYETVFDDGNNNVDLNTLTSTRSPKTTKKYRNNHDDEENSIENDIAYESKSIKTSAASRVINSFGFHLIMFSLLSQRYFMSSGSS